MLSRIHLQFVILCCFVQNFAAEHETSSHWRQLRLELHDGVLTHKEHGEQKNKLATLQVAINFDGAKCTRVWAKAVDDMLVHTYNVVGDGLQLDGQTLSGRIAGWPAEYLQLELKIDGSQLSGNFSGRPAAWWNIAGSAATGEARPQVGISRLQRTSESNPHELNADFTVSGRVHGQILSAQDLKQLVDPLLPGQDWPQWRGPFQNGAAVDCGKEMVRAWKDARLLWISEAHIPHAYSKQSGGRRTSAGYEGPIVADGLVYQVFSRPSAGLAVQRYPFKTNKGKFAGHSAEEMAKLAETAYTRIERVTGHRHGSSAIMADDVIVAMDGQTGATKWMQVIEKTGIHANVQGGKLGKGKHAHPCIKDGRLYYLGLSYTMHAFDSQSGEPLWSRSLQAEREQLIRSLENKLQGKTYVDRVQLGGHKRLDPQQQAQTSPALIDGVLVCPMPERGLIGLDPQTGETVWEHVKDVVAGYQSPVAWSYEGQEYVLTGHAALHARTGKVLWRVGQSSKTRSSGTVVHYNNYLLASGNSPELPVQGFKISASGVEEVWRFPDPKFAAQFKSPALYKGKFYMYLRGGQYLGSEGNPWPFTGLAQIDPKTGVFKRIPDTNRNGSRSIVISDNRLFVDHAYIGGSFMPGMYAIAEDGFELLDPEGGQRLAIESTSAIAGGRMFIRGLDGVYCYDLRVSSPKKGKSGTSMLLLASNDSSLLKGFQSNAYAVRQRALEQFLALSAERQHELAGRLRALTKQGPYFVRHQAERALKSLK